MKKHTGKKTEKLNDVISVNNSITFNRNEDIQSERDTDIKRPRREGEFATVHIDLQKYDRYGIIDKDRATELSLEQLERIKQLANPDLMFDHQGNIVSDSEEIMKNQLKQKQTYFLFKHWRLPVTSYIKILTAALLVGLFFERYFFVLMVYQSQNYGAVLIILLIFFNAIFLYIIKRLRQNKQRKRLHEIYNIEQAPRTGFCEIGFLG